MRCIQGQIVVLDIAFQPALPFQVSPNPMRDLMHQQCQFSTGGFIGPRAVVFLTYHCTSTLPIEAVNEHW